MKDSMLDSVNSLNEFLKKNFKSQAHVEVLEAGCGSLTRIVRMDNFQITGIDISQKQLDRNNQISKKICGDIQKYKFDNQSFDLIISYYVLEHLKYPKEALKNFTQALKPNGLIVLALPNLWSVKGLVTKLTPTDFHVWYYRHILKKENAGKDDIGPFKTYLKKEVTPSNIKKFAKKNGLKVVFLKFMTIEHMYNKARSKFFVHIAQELFSTLIYFLSLGKVQKKDSDFIIGLKKT